MDGITYELDLNELIDSNIYMSSCFEPELTNAIKVLTKPGDTILDIGANIGCHTLQFSKLVGHEGKVFAFEPTGYAYNKIRRNVELNCHFSNNITLEKKAVSDTSAKDQIIHFKSSWLLFGHQTQIHEEVVDIVTVDDYVRQKGLEQIDIIKIDVDGFEPEVLEGAMNVIKTYKPILLLEINNTQKLECILEFLMNMNYLFVNEKEYAPMRSKEEIMRVVNSKPVNSTGFKAANFILLNDESVYNCLKESVWTKL